jgi:hypothetical protein
MVMVAYDRIASLVSTPMPAELQRRVVAFADRHDNPALVATVVSRPDVCADVLAAARTHRSALVVAAWVANPATDLSSAMELIGTESRVSVLVAITEHPGCPVEMLAAAAGRSTSLSVAEATLATGRLPTAQAIGAVSRIIATRPQISSSRARAVHVAATEDPELTAAVLGSTSTCREAAVALSYCPISDPASVALRLDELVRSTLTAPDIDWLSSELNAALECLHRLTGAITEADDMDVAQVVAQTADWLVERLDQPDLRPQVGFGALRQLAKVRAAVADPLADLAAELDGVDLSDDDWCARVLDTVNETLSEFAQTGTSLPRSAPLEALTLDMFDAGCSDELLVAALATCARTDLSLWRVLSELCDAGTPVAHPLLVDVVAERSLWEALDNLADLVDDAESFLLGVLDAPALVPAASTYLLNFEELPGSVSDRLAEVVDMHTLVTSTHRLPATPARLEVTAKVFGAAAVELDGSDEAWHVFEECGDPASAKMPSGTPLLEVARFASAVAES